MPKAPPARSWAIEQVAKSIHRIRGSATASQPFSILLRADAHHDSHHCDRELEKKHLEHALKIGAPVLDIGDCFDCMESRNDPRRSGNKHEFADRVYLDAILDDALDFYSPYARSLALFGHGNHESKIMQHCDIDLTANLTARLTERTGFPVMRGGYGGWVVVELNRPRERSAGRGGSTACYKIRYHHGSGKGAMMTFGTLDSRRMASWICDADCLVTSHTHDHEMHPIPRELLVSQNGAWEVVRKEMQFVRVGTYKDEHGDGSHGFAVEKNFGPKPLGAVWLHLTLHEEKDALGRTHFGARASFERAT